MVKVELKKPAMAGELRKAHIIGVCQCVICKGINDSIHNPPKVPSKDAATGGWTCKCSQP